MATDFQIRRLLETSNNLPINLHEPEICSECGEPISKKEYEKYHGICKICNRDLS